MLFWNSDYALLRNRRAAVFCSRKQQARYVIMPIYVCRRHVLDSHVLFIILF